MSTYADALPGIQERLESVSGLARVIAGEPSSMPVDEDGALISPLCYFLFDSTQALPQRPKRGDKCMVMIRVLVRWIDNELCEAELAPFVDSIPDAFDPDIHAADEDGYPLPTLGGRVAMAQLLSAQSGESAGFHTIADVPYRSIAWTLAITRKAN